MVEILELLVDGLKLDRFTVPIYWYRDGDIYRLSDLDPMDLAHNNRSMGYKFMSRAIYMITIHLNAGQITINHTKHRYGPRQQGVIVSLHDPNCIQFGLEYLDKLLGIIQCEYPSYLQSQTVFESRSAETANDSAMNADCK